METYYIDGKFVRSEKAMIPVNDLAVLRGYGVFDFLRTYGGRPFYLKEHVARLEQSARLIGLPFPFKQEEIADVAMETLSRNRHQESNIRLVLTGGPSPDFITPEGKPRLLVLVTPVASYPRWWYTDGVKIITIPSERYLPGAKTINYMSAIIALAKAREEDAVEALAIDRDGKIREGKTSNCFAFIGDKLVTTGEGILPGITRRIILELAEGLCLTEIRDLTLDELRRADEIFITSTNKEVVPVARLNDSIIGDGKPGRRTKNMMELFRGYTARFAAQKTGRKKWQERSRN